MTEDNDDVYDEEKVEEQLDDDEISDNEAGFMEGFDRAEDKDFEKSPGKKKRKNRSNSEKK